MKPRTKLSLGAIFTNDIPREVIKELPYELNTNKKYYLFDIIPMGAVRMTQSDRWKTNPEHENILKRQRSEVTRYFQFKKDVRDQARDLGFQLESVIDIVFCVPMPMSWSAKKREEHNKMPCKVRPDLDNYIKAFMDALLVEDGHVWKVTAEKRYAYVGSIIVYQ